MQQANPKIHQFFFSIFFSPKFPIFRSQFSIFGPKFPFLISKSPFLFPIFFSRTQIPIFFGPISPFWDRAGRTPQFSTAPRERGAATRTEKKLERFWHRSWGRIQQFSRISQPAEPFHSASNSLQRNPRSLHTPSL